MRFPLHVSALFAGSTALVFGLACGGESKPAASPSNMEMVPINTASTAETATVAHTDAVIETQAVSPSSASSSAPGSKGPKSAAGGAKVSAAECEASFDKYLQLMAASDPRLQGLPPEILAQAKQMAMAQGQSKGGSPCAKSPPTRAQYDCAMAATSSSAWQQCMK